MKSNSDGLMGCIRASFKGKTDVSVYISGLYCQKIEVIERRDLRKSIVGSLDRIDYPLLSGPYSKPISLINQNILIQFPSQQRQLAD